MSTISELFEVAAKAVGRAADGTKIVAKSADELLNTPVMEQTAKAAPSVAPTPFNGAVSEAPAQSAVATEAPFVAAKETSTFDELLAQGIDFGEPVDEMTTPGAKAVANELEEPGLVIEPTAKGATTSTTEAPTIPTFKLGDNEYTVNEYDYFETFTEAAGGDDSVGALLEDIYRLVVHEGMPLKKAMWQAGDPTTDVFKVVKGLIDEGSFSIGTLPKVETPAVKVATTKEEQKAILKELIAKGKESGYLTKAEYKDATTAAGIKAEHLNDVEEMLNDLGVFVDWTSKHNSTHYMDKLLAGEYKKGDALKNAEPEKLVRRQAKPTGNAAVDRIVSVLSEPERLAKFGPENSFTTYTMPELDDAFKKAFGGFEPNDADRALMLAFGHGYSGKGKKANLVGLDDMLKVSASLLEAAPDMMKNIDTVFKFSNGAPIVLWRSSLTKKAPTPRGMFAHRINNPQEIGSHTGTFDAASHENFLGKMAHMRQAKLTGDDSQVYELQTRIITGSMPYTLSRIEHRIITDDKVRGVLESYLENTLSAGKQSEVLMKHVGDDLVYNEAKTAEVHFIQDGLVDEYVDAVMKVVDEFSEKINDYPLAGEAKVEFLANTKKHLKENITEQIKAGGGFTRRPTATSVPYIPVVKKPLFARDMGGNDAVTLMKEHTRWEGGITSKPVFDEADLDMMKELMAEFRDALPNVASDTEVELLFQKLLKKRGYDAIAYVNPAEGSASRMSMTVFDEATVLPLHEVVPSLKKLQEALRNRVYNLLAVGVPLATALEVLRMEGENVDD